MNIQLEDGSTLGGSELINTIYRTDLVPVPVTLEVVVKASDKIKPLLTTGRQLTTPKGVPLVIVKSQIINESSVKAGRRISAIHVVAIMAGCEALIGVTKKATSLENTSFNEIYRALGAKLRIKQDIKVSRFVCLKGQLPTAPIAIALQKEAAVMCHTDKGMSIIRLNELMNGDGILFDKSALQWVENPNAIRHSNTNYLSIDDDGSTILGSAHAERSIRYYPRADNRELQNLRRILITKATITRQLDDRLDAGKLIDVDGQKLVILTAAHRYDTGALGGQAVTATKAWLARVEDKK